MKPPIALFGGTFDPVHYGHLYSIKALMTELAITEARLLPCHKPPHRQGPSVSSQQRLAMAQLAAKDIPGLFVDDRELARDRLSYTIDTLIDVRNELGPNQSICWVMGLDAFAKLDSWHRWQELLDYAHLLVMARPGAEWPEAGPVADFFQRYGTEDRQAIVDEPAGSILALSLTPFPISATAIRKQLQRGERPRQWVPRKVLNYIDQFQLYQ